MTNPFINNWEKKNSWVHKSARPMKLLALRNLHGHKTKLYFAEEKNHSITYVKTKRLFQQKCQVILTKHFPATLPQTEVQQQQVTLQRISVLWQLFTVYRLGWNYCQFDSCYCFPKSHEIQAKNSKHIYYPSGE